MLESIINVATKPNTWQKKNAKSSIHPNCLKGPVWCYWKVDRQSEFTSGLLVNRPDTSFTTRPVHNQLSLLPGYLPHLQKGHFTLIHYTTNTDYFILTCLLSFLPHQQNILFSLLPLRLYMVYNRRLVISMWLLNYSSH